MPLIQRRILNIRPNRCDNLVAHIGLLFNMCYHDLVNLLSESTGGICNNSINGFSYYVFCHAIWYSLHYNYSQIVLPTVIIFSPGCESDPITNQLRVI